MSDEIVDSTQIDQNVDPDEQWNDGLEPQDIEEPVEFDGTETIYADPSEIECEEDEDTTRVQKFNYSKTYFEQQSRREADLANIALSRAVKKAYIASGLTRREFAHRLGVSYNAVSAALSPKSWRVSTAAKLLAVLGKRMVIHLVPL